MGIDDNNIKKLMQVLKVGIKNTELDEEEKAYGYRNYVLYQTDIAKNEVVLAKLQYDFESVSEDTRRHNPVYILNNEVYENFRGQGYGTLLTSYFLHRKFENYQKNYCTCYCSPANYVFYFKMGFLPYIYSDIAHWFELDDEQKKTFLMENYPKNFSRQVNKLICDKKSNMPLIFHRDEKAFKILNQRLEKLLTKSYK